ncbi:hypothetical protein AJ87_40220 [Rhizobium yanglingense]|nr:hypothetical protein AJ87_40220 [Rhizobium yanglingense]
MLNAAVKACPVFGGKIASFDAAAVAARPGVRKVVQVDEATVAVVAETWWQAQSALNALPVAWDDGPNTAVTSASIAAMLAEGLDADDAFVGTSIGDAPAALEGAARVVTQPIPSPIRPMPRWSR